MNIPWSGRYQPWLSLLLSIWLVAVGELNLELARAAEPVSKPVEGWNETGLTTPELPATPKQCIDPIHPSTVLVNQESSGTFAYNWLTGQKSQLNNRLFDYCGPNGWLYATNPTGALRYSLDDPGGLSIEHRPTHFAQDGSAQLYSFENGRVWYSNDSGSTWQERGQALGSNILSVGISSANARSIYAATGTYAADKKTLTYNIFFSADGGITWEERANKRKATGLSLQPALTLSGFLASSTPLDYLELTVGNGGTGDSNGETVYISADGGRTFSEAGKNIYKFERVQVYATIGGLIRLRSTESSKYSLSFSVDGGRSWQKRDLPFQPKAPTGNTPPLYLGQVANLPGSLYITEPDGVWFSTGAGQTWQKLGENYSFEATPYAPLTLLGYNPANHKFYTIELPEAAKTTTSGVSATGAPNSSYFPPTQHNLSGVFKTYWEQHGGLAQFGYPRTEPFREINPSDGKVYLVQYFERNRFEYHPENSGTQYEVLLGLLGNQLTEQRRNNAEAAFGRVEDAHFPAGTFFSQTGHNLKGSFKSYWEQHGGLAIYGYPISEEFAEVNPDDGKTYAVQYFERNRFEYHSENAGTQYEVLLGLLGNTLLKNKGWL